MSITKRVVARSGINDIACPIMLDKSHKCTGVAFIPVTLLQLAKIRTGEQLSVDEPVFSCNHKISVTLHS